MTAANLTLEDMKMRELGKFERKGRMMKQFRFGRVGHGIVGGTYISALSDRGMSFFATGTK